MKSKVYIIDTVRTPWGIPGGSLEKFMSSDLSAAALKKLLERTGVEPSAVDQVVFGQAHPSTMPNNIGHYAWLKAELPVEVPGYTVQSNTASALQALRNAYYLIASGNEEIVIAGGADSYSAAPFVMRDVRNHFYAKDRTVIDTIEEAEVSTQPEPMTRREQYQLAHGTGPGEAEEEFARQSRQKAAAFAAACGDQIVPVSYTDRKKGEIVISEDEWPGKEPEPGDPLAPYADGAAVTMLMSAEQAEKRGIVPKAELAGFAVAGCDPKQPHTAGIRAVKKLLEKNGVSIDNISALEIIENSAKDVLKIVETIGGNAVINPLGGAMAFGKNDGAEGIAMLQRLVSALNDGEYGIACVYSAGGQGMAALVKAL
nr:thiolase family protein [Lachnospiraceae bacterium]